jgi:hypothetical protein
MRLKAYGTFEQGTRLTNGTQIPSLWMHEVQSGLAKAALQRLFGM